MNKRGQNASGAAILLVVLAVMILLYVTFLPSDQRAALLNEERGGGGGSVPGAPANVLLSQRPGTINPPSPNEVEHTLPSFTVFTRTNAEELERKSALIVKNGVFSEQTGMMNFRYDPSNTKNVMLSFNAKKSGGRLIIKLNGEEIYNSELNSGSPAPIQLPESLLQTNNQLTFEASSPGMFFWSVNTHELVNVIVSGEVTDRSGSISAQHFSMPESEYEAMKNAELKFLPNCDPQNAGRLRINVNGREIFSGYPDCGVPNKVEIAKELLETGDNTLRVVSQQGEYLIDLVKVTSKMTGQNVPVFYFNLPNHMYDRIYFNDALLFITLRFADARSLKSGVLNVNGFETTFRTQDLVYQTQVNPEFLMPGPNSVMIIPQGQVLEVVELRVETS